MCAQDLRAKTSWALLFDFVLSGWNVWGILCPGELPSNYCRAGFAALVSSLSMAMTFGLRRSHTVCLVDLACGTTWGGETNERSTESNGIRGDDGLHGVSAGVVWPARGDCW